MTQGSVLTVFKIHVIGICALPSGIGAMTGHTGIKHNSIDRILMRVCAGPCSPEELRESCNLGAGVVLRGATILQEEGLIARGGVGRLTQYVATPAGHEARSRLRRGYARQAS